MRAIGALYMRLVGKALDVYQYLEPLLNDYRKLRLITGNEMASHTKRDLRRAPCLPRHRARASRAPTTARQCCVGCASAGPSAPRPLMRRVSVSIFSQRTRGRCRHPERMAWAGYDVTYMDEFIDKLLREDMVLDIALPTLPKRMHLEEARQLQPREGTDRATGARRHNRQRRRRGIEPRHYKRPSPSRIPCFLMSKWLKPTALRIAERNRK